MVSDAVFSLVNDVDPTKRALFSLSGIPTATTRTFTLPNTSSELAILAGIQTFTGNKTFSGMLTASGATATIGTSAATSTYGLGTGATTTGLTKTVNLGTGGASGSNTVVNIGSATAGAGGTTVVNTPTVTFANAVTAVGMPQANLTAQLLGLGGATADATNRLSINAPAVLLNNAGAGIEVTVNKAAAANDAAFAFKTGFSARALIGLLGSDDFSFKVSPDGSTWNTGLTMDRATGRPTLPQGAVLGGLAADPSGRADGWIWFNTTAQRLRARADGVDFNLGPLTGVGLLAVADNALEASSVISALGIAPTSIITVSLAPSLDADENSPDLLDLVTLWAEAGTDQITLSATFSDPTSGAVKINWSAN